MAQDVALWGVAYTDVPEVRVPKSGGGMAAFYDVSDTTASAEDVAQGKLFYTADGTLTTGTASGGGGGGGGGEGNMSDPIRFFDYDGTLVASYTAVPSELPAVPTHDGLVGSWNYTLEEVDTQFANVGACDAGASYRTTSGATEIDCVFTEGRTHPYLRFAISGTAYVDWGDGSERQTVTGTSLVTAKSVNHTYERAGSYTINIVNADGSTYAMYGTQSSPLLHANQSSLASNTVYADCVKRIRIGPNCYIGNYAFCYCYSLQSVSIPSTVASFGQDAFNACYSLHSLVIPRAVSATSANLFAYCYSLQIVSMPINLNNIYNYNFRQCYGLKSITLPSGITGFGGNVFYDCRALHTVHLSKELPTLGVYMFANCYALRSIGDLSGLTSIGNNAFGSCYGITSLSFGSSLASVGATAFAGCYGMKEYHFASTTPPTLVQTSAFNNIKSDCIIYVPYSEDHSILEAYQTAANWSNYASYMQEEPA